MASYRKVIFVLVIILLIHSGTPLNHVISNSVLTELESQVIALINGTRAYNYDLELEKVTLNHSISNYSFRSAGSVGAMATAHWIQEKFESFGLETSLEPFEFTSWNLPEQPTMVIDLDGSFNTTNDQMMIDSFRAEHYSWSTPEGGLSADIVVLPLPEASGFSELGKNPIDSSLWAKIGTYHKIVLVGREVLMNKTWADNFFSKVYSQPPAMIVYTWWYSWMSFAPPYFRSAGGTQYWSYKIPVGWVNYYDGLWLRNMVATSNVVAQAKIQAVIGRGTHYNVVGKLKGSVNPEKTIIVSGHYDTVMDSGFCDNGAGVAGILELSRTFTNIVKESHYRFNYTILFIAFASEELGYVGSINYIKQHKSEMNNIVAVVNLDCIGSTHLQVTRTNSLKGLDLAELILESAGDLNVSAIIIDIVTSDQETFRNPAWADKIFSQWLSAGANIGDAIPVEASTALISYPLLTTDKWKEGSPGWIHTLYDNSTSTQTLGWVEPSRLGEHIKVAALSILRLLPLSHKTSEEQAQPSYFQSWMLGVVIASFAIILTFIYFYRMRRKVH